MTGPVPGTDLDRLDEAVQLILADSIGVPYQHVACKWPALLAEVRALRDRETQVRALCAAAEERGRAAIPDGMTLSGCFPAEASISPWEVLAVLDGDR